MDSFYLLTALSTAMFVGSFLAGLIPLAFSMSESRTRLLSTFGAGLLVGTSLCVIIPEGVESLYLSHAGRHSGMVVQNPDAMNRIIKAREISDSMTKINQFNESIKTVNEESIERRMKRMEEKSAIYNENTKDEHGHNKIELDITEITQSIGYALVIGFIFMLIVDQISRSASSEGGDRSRSKITATVGLITHAAADGIALGSASATNRTDIQFIVFLAVMLHKAPAAFGLVSFLLVEGLERFRIRRHLFAFSVAAPVAAVITFYVIISAGNDSLAADSATGTLMLFSAGTFLYVATVHILPELINSSTSEYLLMNKSTENGGHIHRISSGGPLTIKELGSIIIGAILPTVLAKGHSH